MPDTKPKLSMKRPLRNGEYVDVTNDQIAFPKKPRGAVPDGEHLSAREWNFMVLLGRWCYRGLACTWSDLELADAMGLPGTEASRRFQVKALINGRWVKKVRWPGLCDPSRGFIIKTYAKEGRNSRQLFTTKKWEEFARAMHRLVPAPTDEDGMGPSQDENEAPELRPAIVEAAAIAEKHILPPLVGHAVAEMIRGDHRWSRLLGDKLDTLSGVVWMAAKRKPRDPFAWIRTVAINGYNAAEAEADKKTVLERDTPKPGTPQIKEEPSPPPTVEQLEELIRQHPGLRSIYQKMIARLKNPTGD